jgi:hypothetical protein
MAVCCLPKIFIVVFSVTIQTWKESCDFYTCSEGYNPFLGAFAQIAKIFVMSVRLSVRISAASTGRIFVKFDIGDLRKSVGKLHIWLKLDENIEVTRRRKYVYIFDSSTLYFVPRQQCKGNPCLHFYGNTEHLYTVDTHKYVHNNIKRKHCFFHSNNGYAKAPQGYVLCTLPVLLCSENGDYRLFLNAGVYICTRLQCLTPQKIVS